MQQTVAIEEMTELTKELCKYKRGMRCVGNITDVIADVEIMLGQLKIMFDNEAEVLERREFKIKRLAERLRGENSK